MFAPDFYFGQGHLLSCNEVLAHGHLPHAMRYRKNTTRPGACLLQKPLPCYVYHVGSEPAFSTLKPSPFKAQPPMSTRFQLILQRLIHQGLLWLKQLCLCYPLNSHNIATSTNCISNTTFPLSTQTDSLMVSIVLGIKSKNFLNFLWALKKKKKTSKNCISPTKNGLTAPLWNSLKPAFSCNQVRCPFLILGTRVPKSALAVS